MDLNKELEPENLTQKDIMTFLLHSTQHVATREELQDVRVELKSDIANVKSELKSDIANVKSELKSDIAELKSDINKLDIKIDKVDSKFDRMQWLIISTILTVLLKDYIIAFFERLSN